MTALKDLIANGSFISAPGVFDPLSARVPSRAALTPLHDRIRRQCKPPREAGCGLVSYREMVDRVRAICEVTTVPLIADGDTGFGGLANVRQAVQGYEKQGPARYKSRIRNTRNVAATHEIEK